MESVLQKKLATFSSSTNGIDVSVVPEYLIEHSDPQTHQFVWAYHVAIKNSSNYTIQILSRHWKIADSNGLKQEIVGEGLVGRKPTLQPGETFDYSSGTPLKTPSGFMSGQFHAIAEACGRFTIEVPAFALDSPLTSEKIH